MRQPDCIEQVADPRVKIIFTQNNAWSIWFSLLFDSFIVTYNSSVLFADIPLRLLLADLSSWWNNAVLWWQRGKGVDDDSSFHITIFIVFRVRSVVW
jgi:hypothetical protein